MDDRPTRRTEFFAEGIEREFKSEPRKLAREVHRLREGWQEQAARAETAEIKVERRNVMLVGAILVILALIFNLAT